MRSSSWLPRSALGWVAFGGLAVLLALTGYALTTDALSKSLGSDVSAYWNAAERLRAGEPLYVAGAANASDLYRYAPWFAYAWIPLTFLEREIVTAGWVGLMIAAAFLSTLPLLRSGPAGWGAFVIFAPLQLQAAVYGNVQPLLVLVLLWGVERRSGPFWIALGASLKVVPVLLALVYAGRGEWRAAGIALALTVVLVAPALLFGLTGYSTDAGPRQISLAAVSAFIWLPLAIVANAATWLVARTRFAWTAAALGMLAALPRLLDYEFGFLLIGLARRRGR